MGTKIKSQNQRHSAADLLDAGLNLLATESVHQLTIDALCKRLGVTKGSFYHHFSNRSEFLERMLEYWVDVWTLGPMRQLDDDLLPLERYRLMLAHAPDFPMDVETSIRAWAQSDVLAQKYLQQVDDMRLKYLCDLFAELCGDKERAEVLAVIDYGLFVGTRMISPPVLGENRLAIINLLIEELYCNRTC